MTFHKGQKVIASDIEGNPHRMKVWRETEKSVFVASEGLYSALDRGETERWPVAVPKSDVRPSA